MCNLLRKKFNVMTAIILANPSLAHIFPSIVPVCLGAKSGCLKADEYPLSVV